MKTTLELPNDLFRLAKITAARQGRPLKDIFAEALREKLMKTEQIANDSQPPWMQFFGAFGELAEHQAETHRLQDVIDAEFGTVDPLEERRN